ncbi:MAG: metalloregulator ArsR/SmtB family transcription factor [Anaerolineales bacterium]
MDALGDPTRRRLFERLREGPCSVGELAAIVPVSQPAVSQHLRVLKEAHLVKVEKKGQQRIYSLNPSGLAELRHYVDALWDDALHAFEIEAARVAQSAANLQAEASSSKGSQIEDTAILPAKSLSEDKVKQEDHDE